MRDSLTLYNDRGKNDFYIRRVLPIISAEKGRTDNTISPFNLRLCYVTSH